MATRTQAERTGATTGILLDAARDLFGRQGYAQTSTEDVVAAARVTRGALYHHFGNKEGLFAAVFEREEERLAAAVVRAAASLPDPEQRIKTGCRVFLEACLAPEFPRISLVDGPAVLGHERVREVESAHTFHLLASDLRVAAGPAAKKAQVHARASLLFGALCEAGRYVAAAPKPRSAMKTVLPEVHAVLDGVLAAGRTSQLQSA